MQSRRGEPPCEGSLSYLGNEFGLDLDVELAFSTDINQPLPVVLRHGVDDRNLTTITMPLLDTLAEKIGQSIGTATTCRNSGNALLFFGHDRFNTAFDARKDLGTSDACLFLEDILAIALSRLYFRVVQDARSFS